MNSKEKGDIGEQFVNDVICNSFMEYWCYPSPRDEKGDKKEICDLLVLFENIVLIISVKNYEFKENHDRYFRKTIDKAVKQIYGAERKLFFNQREIYIKHPKKEVEKFNNGNFDKIFRIIVNLGENSKFYPFNRETPNEKFITIFDKEAFQAILQELDTIPDFIEYLTKREELFINKNVVVLPSRENDFSVKDGLQLYHYINNNLNLIKKSIVLLSGTEHDLLAHYLKNKRSFPDSLNSTEYNWAYMALDGSWETFISDARVIQKKESDKQSYFIDDLVKREILSTESSTFEELAKELLSFDRLTRRLISISFFRFYEKNKNNFSKFTRAYLDAKGKGIVFALYPSSIEGYAVDILLDIAVENFCVNTAYKNSTMILIANNYELSCFNLKLIKNIKPFSKEKEEQISEDVSKLGWSNNYRETYMTEKEYPDENKFS